MRRRVLVSAVVAVLVAVLGLWALGWRQVLAPVAPPAAGAFDGKQVERGRWLAALGSCGACHTASDGVPYAGGAPVQTRFGTVYGTNITPDPDHGIGRWSLEAFTRAMRDGVARDGRHLYPVFPYQHVTPLADDDIAALYAFLMTRDAVPADAPPNRLAFPFKFRPVLVGWKLFFLRRDAAAVDTVLDARWSRGA